MIHSGYLVTLFEIWPSLNMQVWLVKLADGVCTHQQRGQPSHHGVQQRGWDSAAVLRSKVGFGVGGVVAEKALHMHAEGVGVLKVVGQHDGSGHDHQLEVQHDADGEQETFN